MPADATIPGGPEGEAIRLGRSLVTDTPTSHCPGTWAPDSLAEALCAELGVDYGALALAEVVR